jgi:hypothetical protein
MYSFHGFVAQFSKSTECRPSYYREHCCDDVQLWIQFNWDVSQSPVIFDICRMVTQGKFHSISVSAISLPEHFWRAGSAILLELEEIHVQSHLVGGLFTVLQIEGTQSTDIAYRSLHVLELEDIWFKEYELEDLHGIIAMRSIHGASLRQLRFARCRGLVANQVQPLKEVVEDVDLYAGIYNIRPHACRSTDYESDSDV